MSTKFMHVFSCVADESFVDPTSAKLAFDLEPDCLVGAGAAARRLEPFPATYLDQEWAWDRSGRGPARDSGETENADEQRDEQLFPCCVSSAGRRVSGR